MNWSTRMNAIELRPLVPKLSIELAIIVIGVLIALWANEWWTEHGERAQESEILAAMLEDVHASQVLLAQYVENQDEVLFHLRSVLEGPSGISAGLDDFELAEILYNALWVAPSLDLQMSAYEEIKGAGRLALIQSPELRRSLAEYDTSVTMLRGTRDDLMQHQQTKMDAYAIENFQMVQFAEFFLDEDDKRIAAPDNWIDHRALIGELRFQNLVLTKYAILRIGHGRITDLQTLLKRIEELLMRSLQLESAG